MTKREQILEHIRVEVATEGKVTARAICLYCENRVSRQAFQVAIDRGMQQFTVLKRLGEDATGKTAASNIAPRELSL